VINHGVIQRTLYPEISETAVIGSPSNIFKELHVLNPYIYGVLDVQNFESHNILGDRITASNFFGDGQFIDNITHFGLLTSNVYPKYDKIIDIGKEELMFRNVHVDTVVANRLDIQGKSLRLDVSGICEIDTDRIYMNYSDLALKNQSIDHFAQYIDLEKGEFSVKESGVYQICLYGLQSNRSQNLDNQIVWYVYHYNRSLRRGAISRVEGQRPYSLIAGKLDRIRIQIDPQNNVPLKFNQGVVAIIQDIALPGMDKFFNTSGGS